MTVALGDLPAGSSFKLRRFPPWERVGDGRSKIREGSARWNEVRTVARPALKPGDSVVLTDGGRISPKWIVEVVE